MTPRPFLFLLISFFALITQAQVTETFTDGNYTENPTWSGTADAFVVNADQELQSQNGELSSAYLATPSQSMDNAVWECNVKIKNGTSSQNYVSIYLAADKETLDDCNAYYVQIGNTADEVSLYYQNGATKTKIIDGEDKILGDKTDIHIRVTRSAEGEFALYHKMADAGEFVHEGTATHAELLQSEYFGVFCRKSKSYANNYSFDNISVSGGKTSVVDTIPPTCTQAIPELPNKLTLQFSENISADNATFSVDNGIGNPTTVSTYGNKLTLLFGHDWKKGVQYTISIEQVADMLGNVLNNSTKTVFIPDVVTVGDISFNEIMFDAETDQEYVELVNLSHKNINLEGFRITTRNSSGELESGNIFPENALLGSYSCVALCKDSEKISAQHHTPDSANIVACSWGKSLNNSGTTLYLTSNDKLTIFDSVTYSPTWHTAELEEYKGVALEKNSPEQISNNSASWHSAATHGGTPGYANTTFTDTVAPRIMAAHIADSKQLTVIFSEIIDLSDADFILTAHDAEVAIDSLLLSVNKQAVHFTIQGEFEVNVPYTMEAINVKDLAGNYLEHHNVISTGIATALAQGDIMFNEVLFENEKDAFEYVEIVNLSDKLIDMTGLRVVTRNSDGDLTKGSEFPKSLLFSNAQIALTENADVLIKHHNVPAHANVVSTDWSSLSNDENILYLVSADYSLIYDSMRYDAKWHHPIIKNKKGVSLEKINPAFNSMERNSWHSASMETHYGTPGYVNSQLNTPDTESEVTEHIRLDPEAFSPDGDGYEDVCFIHYEMPENGFVANVSVFTPSGLLLAHITESAVLSMQGYLTWDGTTKHGKNANVGVYVLLFEAFNPSTGEVIKRKMPIVVSGR